MSWLQREVQSLNIWFQRHQGSSRHWCERAHQLEKQVAALQSENESLRKGIGPKKSRKRVSAGR